MAKPNKSLHLYVNANFDNQSEVDHTTTTTTTQPPPTRSNTTADHDDTRFTNYFILAITLPVVLLAVVISIVYLSTLCGPLPTCSCKRLWSNLRFRRRRPLHDAEVSGLLQSTQTVGKLSVLTPEDPTITIHSTVTGPPMLQQISAGAVLQRMGPAAGPVYIQQLLAAPRITEPAGSTISNHGNSPGVAKHYPRRGVLESGSSEHSFEGGSIPSVSSYSSCPSSWLARVRRPLSYSPEVEEMMAKKGYYFGSRDTLESQQPGQQQQPGSVSDLSEGYSTMQE